MIREGRIAGIDFFDIYNWTWGEVQEFVLCRNERMKDLYKNLSIIAARHAHVVCRIITEGGKVNVIEDFPYWSEEEKTEARLAMLKASFMR